MPIKFYSWLQKGMIAATLLMANMANAQGPCYWLIYAPYSNPVPYVGDATSSHACANFSSLSCCPSQQAFIKQVKSTGGILNLNGPVTSCSGYAYYDTLAAGRIKANAGSTVNLQVTTSLTTSGPTPKMNVFVDWNHDGHFDEPGDRVVYTTSASIAGPSWTGSIAVPANAQNGMTRMRLRLSTRTVSAGSVSVASACDTMDMGESEDYVFEVVNTCLEPAVISVSNITCNSANVAWSSRGNATFYDVWVDTIPAPWSQHPKAPDCAPPPYVPSFCSVAPCYCKWWHQFASNQLSTTLPGPVNAALLSDRKYYVCIRTVCDTFLKPLFWTWDTSAKWAIDSFKTLPCCSDPVVTCTSHGPTTLSFAWGPVYTAHNYEYVIATQHGLNPSGGTVITGNSITVPGLTSAKTYYFYLRALCSPTPSSNWVEVSCATDNTTSINNLQGGIEDLVAYPNPAKNMVTIEAMGGMVNNATVTVTDVNGRVVYHSAMTESKLHLNTGSWASGLYIVKYADEVSNKVIKITKE